MGTVGGGVNIVKNGLILYLDAANTKSYVSGSTTWNDISRGGNNGTLVNGPTFSGSNSGSIVFDGANDFLNLGVNTSLITPTVFSIGMWFNANNISLEQIFWGTAPPYTAGFVVGLYNSKFFFQGWNSNGIVGPGAILSSNTWYYMLYIYNSGASSFYLNGTLYSSVGGSTIFTTPTVSVQVGRYAGGGGNFGGRISSITYYNRALTQQEVLQNYNATKTRFNL
jgi:hypothetical protein